MAEYDRVAIETVTVGRGGDRELEADLYRPPDPNGCGVLLIHGGAFVHGDRTQLRGYGILLGRIGYTCLACEYRLAPASKWPAQIDDVNTALRAFHERAPALGVDPQKIAVSGNSAGGQLSLMAAARRESPVAAAIAFYPPTDFLGPGARALGAPDAMQFLVGDDVSEARLASISPVNFAAADFPPTMLVTGNRDELVDWRDSHAMYQRLVDAGARAELHVFEGAPHAFDAIPRSGGSAPGSWRSFSIAPRSTRDRSSSRPRCSNAVRASAAPGEIYAVAAAPRRSRRRTIAWPTRSTRATYSTRRSRACSASASRPSIDSTAQWRSTTGTSTWSWWSETS